jgi:hypothetical protein
MNSGACRIFESSALQQPKGLKVALAILFLVRANELCQTTRNDFDLLRP